MAYSDYIYTTDDGDAYALNLKDDYATAVGFVLAAPALMPLPTGISPRYLLLNRMDNGKPYTIAVPLPAVGLVNSFNRSVWINGQEWSIHKFVGEEVSINPFMVLQGAPGPQGPQGPQGIQGVQGPAGADGVMAATFPLDLAAHVLSIAPNGIDSGQIKQSLIQHAQVILSSADILNLGTTPKTMYVCPAGKRIVLLAALLSRLHSGVDYAGNNSFWFQLTGGLHISSNLNAAFFIDSFNEHYLVVPTTSLFTSWTDKNLELKATGNYTVGNETASVDMWLAVI